MFFQWSRFSFVSFYWLEKYFPTFVLAVFLLNYNVFLLVLKLFLILELCVIQFGVYLAIFVICFNLVKNVHFTRIFSQPRCYWFVNVL